MCDYSLMAIPNRLGKEGEDLITYRFPTGTLGFASPKDLWIPYLPNQRAQGFWSAVKKLFEPRETNAISAVCVPPGARLMLQDIPMRLRRNSEIGPAEEVTFTQLTAARNTHRDAIRFRSGQEILLQQLSQGQRAKVLTLSSVEALESVQKECPDLSFQGRQERRKLHM